MTTMTNPATLVEFSGLASIAAVFEFLQTQGVVVRVRFRREGGTFAGRASVVLSQ